MRGRIAGAAAVVMLTCTAGAAGAIQAHAAPASPGYHVAVTDGVGSGPGGSRAGNRALTWAEQHALGHWYCWAGAGPSCYDCSGLVMAAFGNADGIWLPHSTYLMPGDRHLHWIPLADARRGDILFYGSGHVELDTALPGTSFGAHDSGSRVGWIRWGPWWHPTEAFRVW
jgi:cell wall-associated NlpC family hydrolase